MAGAFAGLLAVGLSKMDGVGDYEGWRWILIVEGLLTVVVAASAYFIVENGPSTATFLTERDRQIIAHRLRNDEFGLVDDSQDSLTENERDQEDEDYIRNKLEEDKRKVNHNRSTIFKMVFGDWHVGYLALELYRIDWTDIIIYLDICSYHRVLWHFCPFVFNLPVPSVHSERTFSNDNLHDCQPTHYSNIHHCVPPFSCYSIPIGPYRTSCTIPVRSICGHVHWISDRASPSVIHSSAGICWSFHCCVRDIPSIPRDDYLVCKQLRRHG